MLKRKVWEALRSLYCTDMRYAWTLYLLYLSYLPRVQDISQVTPESEDACKSQSFAQVCSLHNVLFGSSAVVGRWDSPNNRVQQKRMEALDGDWRDLLQQQAWGIPETRFGLKTYD